LNAVRLSACNRKSNSALHSAAGRDTCLHCSAGKRDEVRHLPAIERQLKNALVLNDGSDPRGSRLDLNSIRLDFDLLRHLTDLQNRVDHRVAVYLQHNAALNKRAKSRQ